MGSKKRLMELIQTEREHFDTLTVGSPEYKESQERLINLEKQITSHDESVGKTVIEGIRVVVGGILVPVLGWHVITAFEKNDSITSSLKRTIDCFIPKRL